MLGAVAPVGGKNGGIGVAMITAADDAVAVHQVGPHAQAAAAGFLERAPTAPPREPR